MYQSILIPTDGSPATEVVVDHAIDLAKTYDAALHALYVVDADFGSEIRIVDLLDALERQGEAAVDEILEKGRAAGIESVEGTVVSGTPFRAILDYIDTHDIDLVVMGTHGRSGVDRYLLGSVTEKVVRLSEVPVLTVRISQGATGD